MFKSIQWKLVLIYILLILLAMEVVGVYLIQSLEKYHINSLTENLEIKAQLIADLTERYLNPTPKPREIDDIIRKFWQPSYTDIVHIVILGENAEIITSSEKDKFQKGEKLLTSEITQATFGSKAREIREEPASGKRYMYLAFPVKSGSKVVGIVYLISSMENIYTTLSDIKAILFAATLIALFLTGFLGFSLSKTITDPIQEVTKKAALLAQGNFDQKIEVKSDDEIGKLTDMFNFMALRLKDTLQEISDEKEKIEAILANMADGVIALNSKGEIIHINPAAMKLLSLKADPTGTNVLSVIQSRYNVDIEHFLQGSGVNELLIKVDKGILKSIIAPLKRENRIIGIIIVLHDITKQQRLEEMRKEFVANVSHELRTPLTTIKSYIETLLDGALNDSDIARQFMGVVNTETDRMTRIVNDLLELSRLDNKETKWNMKEISIDEVLNDAISKLNVSVKKKNQILKTEIDDNLPKIFGDRDKIEQVFQNILSNAIKYTPDGGKIFVQLKYLNGEVTTIFKDTGIGIPADDLPRIFERFYRVDKTRSRDLGGTGLGLSIAKEIIEAHNGKIEIESDLDKGTRVIITLPSLQ